ncbi:MAG: hypothetical protein ACYC0H_05995 [Solirubrobacteraceae bacterium]
MAPLDAAELLALAELLAPPPALLLALLLLLLLPELPQALMSAAAALAAVKARQLLEQPMRNLLLLKVIAPSYAGWPSSGHVSPAPGTR